MPHRFTTCPRCAAPLKKAISWAGTPSEYWYECVSCNTFVNSYIPQEHQAAVHIDDHRYTGNFGGFGTGKTTTSREEIEKHLFITDEANVLVGSNVSSQYEQTIKREFEMDIPRSFVVSYSAQKSYFDLIGGRRLMFRPFADIDKMRSFNLTMFVMVEASEINGEAFHMLKTRLRNLAATIPEYDEDGNIVYIIDEKTGREIPKIKWDWRRGIVESNPDSGWIRTDMLLNSDKITKHGTILDEYTVMETERDPAISSHVASTNVNAYLPPGYIAEISKNKPQWWVSRYIYSSFTYAEGLVYPGATKHICSTFDIPKTWKRICAFDYGLADDAVFQWGAIDEEEGLLYIYREDRTSNRDVNELARIFKDHAKDIPAGAWICAPIIDPKSGPKRGYDKRSLMDLFVDEGVVFQLGYVNVDARILRLNTYLGSGRMRIMDCCTGTIKELQNYKFPDKSLDNKRNTNKPVDKDNHGINCLEWIAMKLPNNPADIAYGVYNMYGKEPTDIKKKNDWMPHALRDEEPTVGTLAYELENFNLNF